VILNFACRETENIFQAQLSRRFPLGIQRGARRKLLALHAATELRQMAVPPGNRLEALKGGRKGQHSIRVNDQWRICFRWQEGGAYDVENCRLSLIMKSKLLANITPGEILNEEFLKPIGITQYRLAKDIRVSPRRINEIVQGQRAITADTALRLGRYFGIAPQFWLNLQTHYDLEREQERLAGRLEKEVKVLAAA